MIFRINLIQYYGFIRFYELLTYLLINNIKCCTLKILYSIIWSRNLYEIKCTISHMRLFCIRALKKVFKYPIAKLISTHFSF